MFLIIPWLGYEYVRELEHFLRQTQEQTLAGTAQAVATALHDRPGLFQRSAIATQTLPELRTERSFSNKAADPIAELGVAADARQLVPNANADEIEQIISGLSRTTARIWVVDRQLRVIARAGSLHAALPVPTDVDETTTSRFARLWERIESSVLHPLLNPIYSLILREPREDFADDLALATRLDGHEVESALSGILATRRWLTVDGRAVVISAAHPIWVGDVVRGAVVVEETTNAVLIQRNRAFERLFDIVLTAIILASTAMLLFASRLSTRIRRLRNEAEQAIDAKGRVRQLVTASQARDEVGDLSRSFSEMLARLGQYTSYQENMANRLSHELRTPIAVVRSSLENLDLGGLPEESRVYMDRARNGLTRLSHILTSMSEASRLDQILHQSDRENFDLCRLVASCVDGYKLAYRDHAFEVHLTSGPLIIDGIPDAIAQLMDKLIANAVDFSTPNGTIAAELALIDHCATLSVANDGPPLPAEMGGQLFESMVSVRTHRRSDIPHLGLGLYVVRLIAEFHGGTARLQNREGRPGVIAAVTLPLAALA